MRLVQTPSLPAGRVTGAVCAGTRKIRNELSEYIDRLIVPEPDMRLPEATSNHADMMCCHIDGVQMFVYDRDLASQLEKLGFSCTVPQAPPGAVYPHDAALNCARIGSCVIYGRKSAAPELVEYIGRLGLPYAAVAQGYVRCSCAIVDARSIITADRGIADAAGRLGIDVLRITPGYIELPGYSYGFIGGACAKLSADKMYFSGSLEHHPDCKSILRFLEERAVEPVFGKGGIFDFGGIIPLTEE